MWVIILNTCSFVSLTDLAPGNDEIYEEKQETFLTVGNPQDGQVVLYKVSTEYPHLQSILFMAISLLYNILSYVQI